jgi:hypothetical protein
VTNHAAPTGWFIPSAATPGLLGGAVLLAGCVPKVPATIVVDETRRPEHERRATEPKKPKPPPGPDRAGPQVVRAELIGGTRVRIHFSEPVVADGFDPNDFRISYLRLYLSQQSVYSNAYYYDVGYLNYGSASVPSQARVRGDKIEIDFAPEISPWFCEQLERNYGYDPPGTNTDAGLFLHYAAGSIPIRDEDGNLMINFGAEWVAIGREQPPQTRLQITGPAAAKAGSGLVRVACGPELPPGPR